MKLCFENVQLSSNSEYPGNTTLTRMSLSSRLLYFKTSAQCSKKVFGCNIYAMKTMMKKLTLGYEKIGACENDCMLYYGDDENKIVCDICDSNH